MLAFIRKWLTSWPVLALLGLVLLAFVVTGVGDPFGRGGNPGGDLAKAGDHGVSEAAVLKRFERVVTEARAQNPGLTQAEAARQGGIEGIAQQLADIAALEAFGDRHGIAVSDRAVDGAIASIDAFRVGGKFDQATYERLLAQQRLSPRELRDGIRSDLMRKQMLVPVATAAQVPLSVAAAYARLLLDSHEGAGATVPPPAVAAPTADQIGAYYKSHQPQFMAPERRAFRYAIIDRAGLAARSPVTDAEIAADFDKNKESYGAVEQRRLSQLVLPDAAKAKAFVAAVQAGQDFAAAAAKATGASAADVALGLLTRDKYAAAANQALAGQVFAAARGALIGPVQTDFGWNVVRVDDIVQPQGKTLATLGPLIMAKLTGVKADAALSDTVGKVEDGLGSGKSFADTIKEQGLTAVAVPPTPKSGGGDAALAPVAAKAFDLDPADGAQVVDLGGGRFALLELGQIVSPAPPPLAQITAQVAAAWTLDARSRAARRIADEIAADVAKGAAFGDAVAKRGLPAAQTIKVRRIDVLQQQSKVPQPVRLFVTLGAGTTRILPAPDGTMVMLHVDRVVPGDVAGAPPLVEATRQQLAQAAPDEIAAAFGKAVERDVGVKLNPAAIVATRRRVIGDTAAK